MLKSSSWRYLLREAVLFLLFSYLLILDVANHDLFSPAILTVTALTLTILALGWVMAGRRAPTPLAKPILLMAAAVTLSLITSIDPRRSLVGLGMFAMGLLYYGLSADLKARGWPAELIVKTMLLVGALIAAFAYIDVIDWYRAWLASSGGKLIPALTYRLPDPNPQAWNFNILFMIAGARALFSPSKAGRWGWGALCVALAGLLYFSSSRGGWLGTAAGLGVLVLAWALMNRTALSRAWADLRQRPLLLTGLTLALLVIAAAGGYLLVQQASHPSHGGSVMGARTAYWGAGIAAFQRAPLTGTGPFTMATSFVRTQSTPPFQIYIHAHSIYFNILGETGIIGLSAFVILLGAAVWALWKRLRAAADPDERALLVGVSAALVASLVHSIFDCLIAGKTTGFWVLLIALGSALAEAPSVRAPDAPTPRAPFRPYWALLAPIGLWLTLYPLAPMTAGADAAARADWPAAVEAFSEAAARDPYSSAVHAQLALAVSMRAQPGDPYPLMRAVAEMNTATALDPDWALNHANLGALLAARGMLSEAREQFQIAVDQAPRAPLYWLNLGAVAEKMHDLDEARAAYLSALLLAPEWGEAYYWRANEFRASVAAQWRASQPAATPALTLAELEAALESSGHSVAASNELARAYLAAGRPADALALCEQAELTSTTDRFAATEVLWLRAEALAALGRGDEAVNWGEQAIDQWYKWGAEGHNARLGWFYSLLVFKQQAMSIEIVPQMVTIRLPDRWAERQARLIGWLRVLKQNERADTLETALRAAVPDWQP